jgi:folylpolyglutamate synthase
MLRREFSFDFEESWCKLQTLMSSRDAAKRWQEERRLDKTATLIPLMRGYLRRLNIESNVQKLPVIHVAGTKGKGSTAAFVESILRHRGLRTGLFTSPHLVDVCERIRIDGASISRQDFARCFSHCFSVFHRCTSKAEQNSSSSASMASSSSSSSYSSSSCSSSLLDDGDVPTFFRFLTLMGLKTFVERQVDVAVVECGVGGRTDATAVVDASVCAVSTLGFDHQNVLGDTLDEIAYEKACIFRRGVPALSVPQPSESSAAAVERIARERGASCYELVQPLDGSVALGLAGEHQRTNAALAVRICEHFLNETCAIERRLPAFVDGLAQCRWPARSQRIDMSAYSDVLRRVALFVDGAHTPNSLLACRRWFDEESGQERLRRVKRVLLFACKPTRSPQALLESLASHGGFDQVLFCPVGASIEVDAGQPKHIADTWRSLRASNDATPVLTFETLRAALDYLPSLSNEDDEDEGVVHILVTGSLYLAGNLFAHFQIDTDLVSGKSK